MRKLYFAKILNGRGHSKSSDFSVKEKEKLFSFFEGYGMKRGTVYNRFFRDGFKEWELSGVESCINDYCHSNGIEPPADMRTFFRESERKEMFISYMSKMGMSRPTVRKRFAAWSFKEWELSGVRNLIDRLLAEEVDDA